jgi:homogentisate phytyltransferase/homogentisate geranylgeranyltransferase
MNGLINFIRFARPHTIIGTTLSIAVLYWMAYSFSDRSQLLFADLGWTLLSCLGANIYIVGLNQITDVAIDRINKPYLPLASGAFSMRTGYWLIGISILLSLSIAFYYGYFLLLTVLLSLLLGTIYSLPPIRLKRFYFWAAFCIIAVRGLIVNLLLFLHFQKLFSNQINLPPEIWLLTGIIFIYSLIIAWYKDIPDMKGDQQFRIASLSLKVGALWVFRVGGTVLSLSILFLIASVWLFPLRFSPLVFSGFHILMLIAFWIAGSRARLDDPKAAFQYYQFVWGLFFLEYISFAVSSWVNGL